MVSLKFSFVLVGRGQADLRLAPPYQGFGCIVELDFANWAPSQPYVNIVD